MRIQPSANAIVLFGVAVSSVGYLLFEGDQKRSIQLAGIVISGLGCFFQLIEATRPHK